LISSDPFLADQDGKWLNWPSGIVSSRLTDEMLLSPTLTTMDALHLSQLTTSVAGGLEYAHMNNASISKPHVLEFVPVIPSSTACTLVETALRLSFGGQQRRNPKGYHVLNSNLETSISLLLPTMFNPGFNERVSQNASFVSKIVHLVVDSWSHNAQGVGLRSKLCLLAKLYSNESVDDHNFEEGTDGEDSTQREWLEKALYRKTWAMMQRKLYNPRPVRNLQFTIEREQDNPHPALQCTPLTPELSQETSIGGETSRNIVAPDEDLFNSLLDNGSDEDAESFSDLQDEDHMLLLDDDEEDDIFTDLMALPMETDGDELTSFTDILAEKEREDIERETEEMLFGDVDEGRDLM
jgi:hypothetical protein